MPYTRIREVSVRQRRRRWLVTGGIAATMALLVGVAAWLARPDPMQDPGDALPPVRARAEVNPAGVVWWADGELHLRRAVVEVADVQRLVAAGTGAAKRVL